MERLLDQWEVCWMIFLLINNKAIKSYFDL
jgi:hypothetical protein